jgi:putative addiction module component (TIGR02574 family)
MSATLEILQAQVLALSKEDRSRLLERLVASLDVDAGAEQAWEALAAERDAELESGSVVGVPIEEAMARLRARFLATHVSWLSNTTGAAPATAAGATDIVPSR